jgi:hypothetical protein
MDENPKVEHDIEPGQEWEIVRFRPADAEGVARLFRSVYGEGYPVRTYVEPQLLIEANAASRIISSVAKTARGDIVGHNALFNSAPHPGTYESGAGVVHAAYRGGKGIFTRMELHSLERAATMPDVEAVFGEPVCNHPFSQKLTFKAGFVSRALEVDLMPAAAYEKEASAHGRVAAFLDFKTFRPKPHTVYLPGVYEDAFRFFYENLDDERAFRLSEASIPAGTVSDIHPQVFDFAAVARVAIHSIGADFSVAMDTLEKTLQERGVLVIQLWLKLDCQWVGAAIEHLQPRGYFLGGALPRWFGTDGMLMQKIQKRPDWEGIGTYTDRAACILEIVRADWERRQEKPARE